MALTIFQANTKARANEVNDNFSFISGNRLIGFNPLTGAAVNNFNIGDLSAIANGSLVGDLLVRSGQELQLYNASGVLIGSVTYDDLLNLQDSTTTIRGSSYLPDSITIANNVTDADHDIDFSAGNFQFSDGTGQAVLASGLIKQLDAAWAAGDNQGGLFTGTIAADTWYHCFAISNASGSLVDVGFDTDVNATNIPVGYTKYKRRGSILTDGSANIRGFIQYGNWFEFNQHINFIIAEVASNFTSGVFRTCPTPLGVKVYLNSFTAFSDDNSILLTDPDNSINTIPSFDNLPATIGGDTYNAGTTVKIATGLNLTPTNSVSQVRIRTQNSNGNITVGVRGWLDYQL